MKNQNQNQTQLWVNTALALLFAGGVLWFVNSLTVQDARSVSNAATILRGEGK